MPKKTKRTVKKSKATPSGLGRPKGSKNILPEGLSVITKSNISRKADTEGLKRLVLATADPVHALRLERLAHMVEKQDRNLFSLITPPSLKKKKAAKSKT